MKRWIDIPAQRILEVPYYEREEFQLLNSDGAPTQPGERIYLVVRKADNRVFRPAEFVPESSPATNYIYLREI